MDPGRPRASPSAAPDSWLDWAVPVLAALLVGSALLRSFDHFGGRDWDQVEADLYSARHALLVERELPLWMPYRGGGHDAFADPQSLWLSPLGLLSLLFGVPVGIRTFFALAAAGGALGAVLLGAQLGLLPLARSLMALLLVGTTVLGLHAAGGLPTHALGLVTLPWVVLCLLRRDRAGVLGGGALLALDLYGGDVNHFVFHSLFLGVSGLCLAALERSPRVLGPMTLLFLAALVFAAPKLVPVGLLALDAPRLTVAEGRALSPRVLAHALLDRDAPRFLEAPLREWVGLTPAGDLASQMSPAGPQLRPETLVHWANVGSYQGPLALLLAAAGLALLALRLARGLRAAPRTPPADAAPRALLALVLSGAVFLWLAFGSNATPSAWLALHELPVFASLRAPVRLILYPVFVLGLLAGVALDALERALRGRLGALPAAGGASLVLLAVLLDVHPPARRAYAQTFVEPPLAGVPRTGEFVQVEAPRCGLRCTYYGPPVAPFAKAGVGVTNGYNAIPMAVSAVPRGDADRYRGEAFTRGGGRVSGLRVTARRIELAVTVERSDTVVINQNFGPGWAVTSPPDLSCTRAVDGRIAVRVPPGTTRLELRYTSPGLGAGLLVAALGVPALLLATRRFGQGPDAGVR